MDSTLSLTSDLRCARVGAVMAVFGDPANQEKQAISMTAPVVTGTQLVCMVPRQPKSSVSRDRGGVSRIPQTQR